MSVGWWEIGAADEGFELRGEPDAHRPPTRAGGGLDEGHVNLVHVGAFLPVEFDVDEILIHHFGDRGVGE